MCAFSTPRINWWSSIHYLKPNPFLCRLRWSLFSFLPYSSSWKYQRQCWLLRCVFKLRSSIHFLPRVQQSWFWWFQNSISQSLWNIIHSSHIRVSIQPDCASENWFFFFLYISSSWCRSSFSSQIVSRSAHNVGFLFRTNSFSAPTRLSALRTWILPSRLASTFSLIVRINERPSGRWTTIS